jgi:methyltransferase (TIGR00027 family)
MEIKNAGPDNTAVRVALWRALHMEIDASPPVFEDTIGLQLTAPAAGWRERPDMHPEWTKTFRASIAVRARFIEDLIAEQIDNGISQYVILGAGLDTFAQRRPELASRIAVFEVDRPGPQAWKRQRLNELGFGIPDWLRLVPVDFEAGDAWLDQLIDAGFNIDKPSFIASTGVSMYLTRAANAATLRQISQLAPGSMLAMSFLQPIEYAEPEEQPAFEMAIKGARASGTPFLSLFTPSEILSLARDSGFTQIQHISAEDLTRRYFAGRTDGLRASKSEELLIATAG